MKIYRRLNEILLANRGIKLISSYGDPLLTEESNRDENFRQLHGAFREFEYYKNLLRNSTSKLDIREEIEELWYVKNVSIRFLGNITRNYSLYEFEDMIMAYQLPLLGKNPKDLSTTDEQVWWLHRNSNSAPRQQLILNNQQIRSKLLLVKESFIKSINS